MTKLPIEELFKYHPPLLGSDRIRKHFRINDLSLELAKAIESEVKDEDYKKQAIFALQQARMIANQGITIDDLVLNNEKYGTDSASSL